MIQKDSFPSHLQARLSLPILAQGAGVLLHAGGINNSAFSPPCSGCGRCLGWAEDVWGVLCQGPTSNHGENQLNPMEFYTAVITSSGHRGYF